MRVVTCDDSVDIAAPMLAANLRQLGHEVVAHGANGEEGIELCRKHKPDLAIFDVLMPRMTGDVAVRTLLAEKLATHVVLATSQGQQQFFDTAADLGIGILIKPYSLGQLQKMLESLREPAE